MAKLPADQILDLFLQASQTAGPNPTARRIRPLNELEETASDLKQFSRHFKKKFRGFTEKIQTEIDTLNQYTFQEVRNAKKQLDEEIKHNYPTLRRMKNSLRGVRVSYDPRTGITRDIDENKIMSPRDVPKTGTVYEQIGKNFRNPNQRNRFVSKSDIPLMGIGPKMKQVYSAFTPDFAQKGISSASDFSSKSIDKLTAFVDSIRQTAKSSSFPTMKRIKNSIGGMRYVYNPDTGTIFDLDRNEFVSASDVPKTKSLYTRKTGEQVRGPDGRFSNPESVPAVGIGPSLANRTPEPLKKAYRETTGFISDKIFTPIFDTYTKLNKFTQTVSEYNFKRFKNSIQGMRYTYDPETGNIQNLDTNLFENFQNVPRTNKPYKKEGKKIRGPKGTYVSKENVPAIGIGPDIRNFLGRNVPQPVQDVFHKVYGPSTNLMRQTALEMGIYGNQLKNVVTAFSMSSKESIQETFGKMSDTFDTKVIPVFANIGNFFSRFKKTSSGKSDNGPLVPTGPSENVEFLVYLQPILKNLIAIRHMMEEGVDTEKNRLTAMQKMKRNKQFEAEVASEFAGSYLGVSLANSSEGNKEKKPDLISTISGVVTSVFGTGAVSVLMAKFAIIGAGIWGALRAIKTAIEEWSPIDPETEEGIQQLTTKSKNYWSNIVEGSIVLTRPEKLAQDVADNIITHTKESSLRGKLRQQRGMNRVRTMEPSVVQRSTYGRTLYDPYTVGDDYIGSRLQTLNQKSSQQKQPPIVIQSQPSANSFQQTNNSFFPTMHNPLDRWIPQAQMVPVDE